ncbi:putative DUF1450-containing protein [Staphylococcus saprophyticus]|nr:putative DUF1450-containing protein [Staphylococcus saprophyticus]
MNPIVEFCISNLAKGGDYVYNQLENDPGIDVLEYGCLQNCGICSSGLYALVNGDIVEGESPDDLLQKNIRTYRRNMDFLGGNCYDSD